MNYSYCGHSGLQLPKISLGLWHNFGSVDSFDEATRMILHAFDRGVTHFDIANNYGPVPGSAETNFGRILRNELASHRDEMIISSKAGYGMWDGPYGDGGSRKYLFASIDQSLKRTGLEYFDIFYSHRYDSNTPIEETMQALVDIVRQGKALYVGISNYHPVDKQRECYEYLAAAHVPCLISQYKYNMYCREPESTNIPAAAEAGSGFIAFSPLQQGLLTNKYLNGIPEDSRAAKATGFLQLDQVTEEVVAKSRALNAIAERRDQSLAQMALAWILRDPRVTSVIVGASSVRQLSNNLQSLDRLAFSPEELQEIDNILGK